MQERFSASLPSNYIPPADVVQLSAIVHSLFVAESHALSDLTEALKQEEKEKFGSPEINVLSFDIKRYDPVKLTGRFRVNYHLRLTFSCSALVNDLEQQHSYWNFEIDPAVKLIHFEGEPYGDLRSTANEY